MNESIEKMKSGREILINMEAENKYVFHGSENSGIAIFEPRQAHTVENGEAVDDDKPAIHASPVADVAILMALINKQNCPDGFDSGFSYDGKVNLKVSRQGLDQLKDKTKGYVYVFSKDDFTQRGKIQVISYDEVKPLQVVEVNKADLSEDIEIKENI
mgnify:CR=1 FL=1